MGILYDPRVYLLGQKSLVLQKSKVNVEKVAWSAALAAHPGNMARLPLGALSSFKIRRTLAKSRRMRKALCTRLLPPYAGASTGLAAAKFAPVSSGVLRERALSFRGAPPRLRRHRAMGSLWNLRQIWMRAVSTSRAIFVADRCGIRPNGAFAPTLREAIWVGEAP